jgi:DNA-directed RNA polymerase subunit RPC12/RpoP
MGIGDWFKEKFGAEEEPPEPMASCSRCGFEFPEDLMINTEDASFCSECHTKRKQEVEELEFKKKQAAALARLKYYCYDCKFHFSRKKDFMLRLCPNCGSENFVEEGKLL